MADDLPLPIADTSHDPWEVEHEHTTLVAHWPGEAPTQVEIIAALQQAALEGSIEVIAEPPIDHDEIRWAVIVAAKDAVSLSEPIFIWCEPSQPAPPQLPNAEAVNACRWVVCFQTVLDSEDPLSSLLALMRLVARACDDSPCILDSGSRTWHTRQELNDIFLNAQVEPPAEVLWTIHAVRGDDAHDTESADTWLHTHGLWRCGKPELEMIGVPRNLAGLAGQLINDVAELLLERDAPPPGERFAIGVGLNVALQPWSNVAPQYAGETPGGMTDRADGDEDHTGTRAVICAEMPRGVFRKHWLWPEQVITKLRDDESAIYHTLRATQRQAALAQSTWDELATAFVKLSGANLLAGQQRKAAVLIKAGFATDTPSESDDDPSREHLWFDIERFDRHRAQGKLINQPLDIKAMKLGEMFWVDRDSVSDWTMYSPAGRFEPKDLAAMWRTVDELTGSR